MPDLGEGLEEGRIVEWLVAPGDTVELNQPFVEVETAKAAVEIPSPFAGTIVALHGTVGEDVPVGDPLATFEVDAAAPSQYTDIGASCPSRDAPVRKLAKELGVDLEHAGRESGTQGRITEGDVRGRWWAADRCADAADHRGQPGAAGGDPAGDDVPDGGLHISAGVPGRGRSCRRCPWWSRRSLVPPTTTRCSRRSGVGINLSCAPT